METSAFATDRAEVLALRRIVFWSFVARLAAGLLGWVLTRYADLPFLQDALYYEELGAAVADDWLAGRPSTWLHAGIESGEAPWLIVITIASFYWITGGLRFIPLLLAFYSAITAFTPLVTYRIARRLGASAEAGRTAAWLVALSPSFAFWSGTLYKEGLILLVLNVSVYHVLILQERIRWRSLVIMGLSVFALLGLRFYLALLMSLILTLGLLMGRGSRSKLAPFAPLRQVVLAVAFVAGMVAIGFSEQAQKVLPATFQAGLDRMQRSRDDLAGAESGYLPEASISTPGEALRHLPLGLAYFLTSPLPWQLGRLRQNLVIPETAFWILLYPVIWIGLRQALRRSFQGAMLVLAVTAAVCCFYALYIGNIGTAYRMRTQVWLLWAVFAGWGWERLKERRARYGS